MTNIRVLATVSVRKKEGSADRIRHTCWRVFSTAWSGCCGWHSRCAPGCPPSPPSPEAVEAATAAVVANQSLQTRPSPEILQSHDNAMRKKSPSSWGFHTLALYPNLAGGWSRSSARRQILIFSSCDCCNGIKFLTLTLYQVSQMVFQCADLEQTFPTFWQSVTSWIFRERNKKKGGGGEFSLHSLGKNRSHISYVSKF